MALAIFIFGLFITGVAVWGLLLIGIGEAADDAHGNADDAFTELERELAVARQDSEAA